MIEQNVLSTESNSLSSEAEKSLIKKNHRYSLIGAGILLIISYFNTFIFNSLPVILPILMISFFGIFVVPIVFLLWTWRLHKRQGKIPMYSTIFFTVMMILCLLYFISGWQYGFQYIPGPELTPVLAILNVVFGASLIILFLWNRNKPSFISNFIFHLVGFIWLASVSFPWLGEGF